MLLCVHPVNPTEPQSPVDPPTSEPPHEHTLTYTHTHTHTLPSHPPASQESKAIQNPSGHPVTQSQSELNRWTPIDNLLMHTHHLCVNECVSRLCSCRWVTEVEWVRHQKDERDTPSLRALGSSQNTRLAFTRHLILMLLFVPLQANMSIIPVLLQRTM